MLALNTIKSAHGSTSTSKRVGRGNGSGKGTFSGRGHNGQNKRSGGGVPSWFEGGQTPLFRRMPKLKGFSNSLFKKEYNVINISDLEFLGTQGITDITRDVLEKNNFLGKKNLPIKLLGDGVLTVKINLTVDKASISAKAAVEEVGGTITVS